jgi:hypothetical protein
MSGVGDDTCEVVIDDVVVADLREARHDLALVDLLARLRLLARREGVALTVRPCDALRGLLVLVGLSGLEERG